MKGEARLPSPEAPPAQDEQSAAPPPPSFAEAFRFWLRLGFISFGGPAGQIAIMQTELVEKRRWISQGRFLNALNFCMLLPGPEAQQLAIYLGWLLQRGRGGLVAGVLFVLPSMFILWALSLAYVTYGHLPLVTSLFHGLQSAVLAIVALALLRIARKALPNWAMLSIALLAFLSLFRFGLPFPFVVLSALLLGYVGGALWPHLFVSQNKAAHAGSSGSEFRGSDSSPPIRPTWRRALRIALIGFTIWWMPILCAGLWQGWSSALYQEGLFFSKAAVVTFGGAYAVLPYVAQQAVETYGWLQPGQMMDGLGLAETTPGPLIMVLQFVGFMGGWSQPGNLSPLLAATLGALLTTWVTFVPCFLWIFLGAPHVEQLRANARLTAALATVTAAVVGVILNLALWFGWHVILPGGRGIDWFALLLGIVAFLGMLRWKWGVLPVVAGSALAGVLYRLIIAGT